MHRGSAKLPVPGWRRERACSLALLVYGLWTRYRLLAAAGQFLLLASIGRLCVVASGSVPWTGGLGSETALTFVPLAVLLATIFAGRRYVAGKAISMALAVYEAMATLFFLGWVCRYFPAETRFTIFSVVGAGISAWAQVRREPRWRWWSAGCTAAGLFALAALPTEERTEFLHLAGVAAIAGQQRFARFWNKREPGSPAVPARWQGAWMIAATLSAWTVLNARVVLFSGGAFTLAAAWSLFAAVVFAAGLTLHEKIYRWLGLIILVCTLGRIMVVDIWQLDSLGRAISALCLGLVLLGIGYVYNRFHTRWHGLF